MAISAWVAPASAKAATSASDVDIWAFTPEMERLREVEGTVRWWPRSGIDLMLGAGRRWIDDVDHVAGVDARETYGFLAVRLIR